MTRLKSNVSDRDWQKKYETDPAFTLESPLEAAAGLMYVAAKCSGDITQEEKKFLLETFQNDFKLTNREATDLLSSHSFIMKDEDKVFHQVNDFLKPSLPNFTAEQIESTIQLVLQVIQLGGNTTDKQHHFFDKVKKAFNQDRVIENWGQ